MSYFVYWTSVLTEFNELGVGFKVNKKDIDEYVDMLNKKYKGEIVHSCLPSYMYNQFINNSEQYYKNLRE